MRPLSLALAASFGVASAAHAYDRPYKLLGVLWDVADGPVPYTVHPDGVDDVPGDEDVEAVHRAFRRWSCVPGTSLRFRADDVADPPKAIDLDDGVNAVFWDETGAYGLGPGTLGVTVGNDGDPDAPIARASADIVFNGADSTWSAGDPIRAVDVESIAVHEIGHLLGLDHPCDGAAPNETNCNDGDRSVMTPAWPGGDARTPLPDDVEGLLALYPQQPGDESTCEGPFTRGERCGGDCECVDGLLCVPGQDGDAVCATTCSSADADCGSGFACVLGGAGTAAGGEVPGTCVKLAPGARKPPAAACGSDGECAAGPCLAVASVGRSICRTACEGDGDCDDGLACKDAVCLAAAAGRGTPCEDEPPACGCAATSSDAPATTTAALAAVVVAGAARRARRRA